MTDTTTAPPLDYSAAQNDHERAYLEKLDASWLEKIGANGVQGADYQRHRERMLDIERGAQASREALAKRAEKPVPAPLKPTATRASEALDALRALADQADGVRRIYAQRLAEFELTPVQVRHNATPGERALAADADQLRYQGAWKEASDQLQALDAEYYQRARAVDEAMPASVSRPPADTVESELLRETKEQRAWQRARQHLDTGDAANALHLVEQFADRAVATHDKDALWSYLAEAPSYLRARGLPADLVDQFATTLHRKAAPVLPNVRQHLDQQAELQALKAALRSEIGSAKRAVITFRRP